MLIATCDDEIIYCNQVEELLIKLGKSIGIEIQCHKYCSGEELLKSDFNQYDIIFLDVDIITKNGIKVAEIIRETNQQVEIVFLTALPQYASDGYRVRAYRYLHKPLEYGTLEFELKDLLLKLHDYKKDKLVLIRDRKKYTLNIMDILYIEASDHYLIYYCVDRNISVAGTLKQIEMDLPEHLFFRVHKSFLVNLHYIENVKSKEIIMRNQKVIPIARRKTEKLRNKYADFLGDELS